jgi:V/A-type H+-transporting ATPase subunit D
MAEIIPTRGAALALAEEQGFMETGFGFLDEKRMMLAANLLAELRDWKALSTDYARQAGEARVALEAAVLRHGLEGVQVYKVPDVTRPNIRAGTATLFGLTLAQEPETEWPAPPAPGVPDASAEAETCRAAFAALIPLAARMAARQVNISRLIREYRATERRARALENVLLPEVRAQRAAVNEHLEEADQEEAIRIRNAAG